MTKPHLSQSGMGLFYSIHGTLSQNAEQESKMATFSLGIEPSGVKRG